MKIGIIKWFSGPNYGTNLQAIALQYYLRKNGNDVKIINYEVSGPQHKQRKKPLIKRIAHQPEKYMCKLAMRFYKNKINSRDQKLSDAIRNNCVLTKKINTEEELVDVCNQFDLLICGSDQIWNPNWYDRFYFADYNKIKTKRISYAPSMGVNTIPTDIKDKIASGISKFDAISVREKNAATLLKSCCEKRIYTVVDPTLLLSADEWEKVFPLLGNIDASLGEYVFAFFLDENKAHFRASKAFAKNKNLKYVVVPYKGISYLQNGKIYADAGLEELLDLIHNAKYVLTDSFHITVFSILYNKQFYTFQRFQENRDTSQNARVTDLLERADLKNRYIEYGSNKIFEQSDINYKKQEQALKSEIDQSKKFLLDAINGDMCRGGTI